MDHVFGDYFGEKHARLSKHSFHFNVQFYQFITNFLRQSHFGGMCEFTTELVDPLCILSVSYAEHVANGVL